MDTYRVERNNWIVRRLPRTRLGKACASHAIDFWLSRRILPVLLEFCILDRCLRNFLVALCVGSPLSTPN